MNDTRVAKGAFVWFLGVIVPVAHHAILFVGSAKTPSDNWVMFSKNITESLPPFDWLYLLGMMIVGLTLVISGIRNKVRT